MVTEIWETLEQVWNYITPMIWMARKIQSLTYEVCNQFLAIQCTHQGKCTEQHVRWPCNWHWERMRPWWHMGWYSFYFGMQNSLGNHYHQSIQLAVVLQSQLQLCKKVSLELVYVIWLVFVCTYVGSMLIVGFPYNHAGRHMMRDDFLRSIRHSYHTFGICMQAGNCLSDISLDLDTHNPGHTEEWLQLKEG